MEYIVVPVILAAAIAAIALPLLYGGRHAGTDGGSGAPVEDEIARYRAAVRADTVCRRCGQANPADSRYCYECGHSLPVVDAQEFDGTGGVA